MTGIYYNATGIESVQLGMYTVIPKSQNIKVFETGIIHKTSEILLSKYDRNENIYNTLEKSNAKRQKR